MHLRSAAFAFVLTSAAAPASAQAPVPASAPKASIQQLFAAANADAAQIPALIVEASAQMLTLPKDKVILLGDTLNPYLERAYFSPERFAGMDRLGLVVHTVAKGENPTKIAQRYKIGAKMLVYLNESFDEKKLHVGQELKVLDLSRGALQVAVSKSAYRLTAWRDLPDHGRALVMYSPVGIGALESPTPIGKTTITKRVLDPTWTDPDTHAVIPPGDARNVLGGYWIALDPVGLGKSGIGLHGFTGSPADDWIAKPASHGCVRMLQRDIDRLFHLAIEGTLVTIEN